MFVLATNVEWHEVGIGKGWLKINIKNHIFGGSLQSKLQFAQQFNAKKWLAGFWAALHGFLFYGPLKRIFARPIVAFVSPPNKSPFGAIFPVFVEAKKTVVVGWSTHWPCASFVCQLSKVPKRISCGRQKGVQEKTTQLVCKVVEEALLGLLADIAITKKWSFGAILREISCRICFFEGRECHGLVGLWTTDWGRQLSFGPRRPQIPLTPTFAFKLYLPQILVSILIQSHCSPTQKLLLD